MWALVLMLTIGIAPTTLSAAADPIA